MTLKKTATEIAEANRGFCADLAALGRELSNCGDTTPGAIATSSSVIANAMLALNATLEEIRDALKDANRKP